MTLTVRPITDDEVPTFRANISRVFGGDHRPEEDARFRAHFELERTVAAFDGDEMVGSGGAFTYDVTVPGGTLPMGGTTIITVLPTHRRRGVLTAMMRAHFEDIKAHDEPLAGLWASESSIYGRFGYGLTTELHEMKFDTRNITFVGDPPPGQVRYLEPEAADPIMRTIYDAARVARPGMLSRSDAWWKLRVIDDPEHWREGKSKKRFAIYEHDGDPEGYVIFRQKEKWNEFPEGEVSVVELIHATDRAHAALWRFIAGIDLFPKVDYWNMPVDDPLPWYIADHRRIKRYTWDGMWVRLMDIPRALTGRAYLGEGTLVFDITDPFVPENDGRYGLSVTATGVDCAKTNAPADLTMRTDTLGALYLGGQKASQMARAGLVEGSSDALHAADRLFDWHVAPWCEEVF